MTYTQAFNLVALAPPPSAPSVYRGYIANNPSDTVFTGVWYAPTSGTGPFTYNVRAAPTGTTNYVAVSVGLTTTDHQWIGLTANTAYDFLVAAVDRFGTVGPEGKLSFSTAPTLPSGAQAFWYNTLCFVIQHVASTTYAEIYYDAGATGITAAQGQSQGQIAAGQVDNIYTNLAKLFGWSYPIANNTPVLEDTAGSKVHLVLSKSAYSSSAGAFHLSSPNTDIFVNFSDTRTSDSQGYAITAEMDEAYMSKLQALPASDYHSMGEALSVAVGFQLFSSDTSDTAVYAQYWLNQSPRVDWVNSNAAYIGATTTDWYYAVGCQAMFLNWLRHKGNTWQTIFGCLNAITPTWGTAPNLSCTPRDIYNQMTGGTSYNPLSDFLADVAAIYPVGTTVSTASIDPWNTAATYVTPVGNGP